MPSKHLKAPILLSQGVFDSISTFTEFENRVSQLYDTNTKAQGDAFEMFVEAYLATQLIMQCKQTWLVGSVPFEVKKKLNLPDDTKGIDGVLQSFEEVFVPYQVKFRSGRPLLGYGEVSAFLGVTDEAVDRLLITNCDSISPDVKKRKGLRSVRGQDFDQLTKTDFLNIESWLKSKPIDLEITKPRLYQTQANYSITQCFKSYDRTNIVMACGTGKTLVSMWATSKLNARKAIIFVPSLTLLQQTLREWCRNNDFANGFSYLCVCSDETVDLDVDDIETDNTELSFTVTTDIQCIKDFLAGPSEKKVKLIFSTYQSSKVISEACKNIAFDLGIFDEAHRTTGLLSRAFSVGLDDQNIKIQKRLFMTATPKIYDLKKKDDFGDFKYLSMDDESRYGPRAFTLTFRDAVNQGIICPYKVVVSLIDKTQVSDYALKNGVTLVDGDLLAAKWVATQLAVAEAIKTTDAKKIISFHSRVNKAKDFASDGNQGIGGLLSDFKIFHVNGKQSSTDRSSLIGSFSAYPKALITNAQCLTEGIDVPAVDMVVFNDPKHSRIAITQAIGRAMRKPTDVQKNFGYVVIPIFAANSESKEIENSISNEDFDDVVVVLTALMEQDEELVQVVKELAELKGRGASITINQFSDKIELIAPEVAYETISKGVSVKIIERTGNTWEEWFGRLISYHRKYKDCLVPRGYVSGNGYKLGQWVATQRASKERLSETRRLKLEALKGWSWDAHESKWDIAFNKLQVFTDENGHCKIPNEYITPDDYFRLYTWVTSQRRKKSELTSRQIQKLESLSGWSWNTRDSKWETGFSHLSRFVQINGHCRVPPNFVDPSDQFRLGSWVARQRRIKGKLDDDQLNKLEGLAGWSWNPRLERKPESGFVNPFDSFLDLEIKGRLFASVLQASEKQAKSTGEMKLLLSQWLFIANTNEKYGEAYSHVIKDALILLASLEFKQKRSRQSRRLINSRYTKLDKISSPDSTVALFVTKLKHKLSQGHFL